MMSSRATREPSAADAAVDAAADAAVEPDTRALRETIAETAVAAGVLGCEMADIAGTIDDVRLLAHSQTSRFANVGVDMSAIVTANERIRSGAKQTAEAARDTRDRVEQSLNCAVGQIEAGLAAVGGSLGEAVDATNEIAQVALQTRMVALNASVQAAHAGTEGNSFAVVASAVRDLAEQIQRSSKTIAAKLAELSATVHTLASREGVDRSGGSTAGLRASVSAALEKFHGQFDQVARRIDELADSADLSARDCARVDASVRSMAAEVSGIEKSIEGAARKSEHLLGVSERLIEVTAASGAETDDTPFIECALAVAEEMSALFEDALERREITMDALFDEHYAPVTNSDPPQHTTRFVALTDRLFTPLQESVLEWSERVVFCAAVDRNGFLPTHNRKYSKPQGADTAWNTANCRNRRLFTDRTGSAAGRNVKPFLVQTYRRDMGGGKFAILKEVDAPINAARRHWGNLRLAFRPGHC
jgi:methyl-accepting chemotaxis protein